MYCGYDVGISVLLDKKITGVVVNRDGPDDEIVFETDDGSYKMYHSQDCCENVYIEDISGNLQGLVGHVVRLAEETTGGAPEGYDRQSSYPDNYSDDSETWTYYNISAGNEDVNIRWYGTSNGYYSESVSVVKLS